MTSLFESNSLLSEPVDLISVKSKEAINEPEDRTPDGLETPYNVFTNYIEANAKDNSLRDDDTKDLSTLSKRRFIKVATRGETDSPQSRTFDGDISYIFGKDTSKFIGEFKVDVYKVTRGYLNSSKHLRLHYTKLEHNENRIASLAIIHGYAEHSERFLDVIH